MGSLLIKVGLWATLCLMNENLNAQSDNPSLDRIVEQLAKNELNEHAYPIALSIGIVRGEQISRYHFGHITNDEKSVEPTDFHFYPIGSLSKLFATTLLMRLVEENMVKLDDPITNYLPNSVRTLNPTLQHITLRSLLTHTSGLPPKPYNLMETLSNKNDPYARYTVGHLYDFLIGFRPNGSAKAAANDFLYSHLGIGLLGHLLEAATGKTYSELLQQYIIPPLGLNNTTLYPTPEQQQYLIWGHTFNGQTAHAQHYASLYASEGLYSTLNNLLKFVYANIDTSRTNPFQSLFQQQRTPCAATPVKGVQSCYGWYEIKKKPRNSAIYTHSARTGGYSHYIAFDPEKQVGVVILSNSAERIDPLGIQLLSVLLEPPPKKKKK